MDEAFVRRDADGFDVDATLIGSGLGLAPERVVALLREGAITSLVERGENEDAGRWRLTFFHASARFRIVVDDEGRVISRSRVSFGGAPLPPAMRRPG
ncbi:DUF6522 family protein [Salinarimonas chemoclinalis]|uniref:DUF6522 family protein n=1 Tax=Salinarimonas chemoclinalis TaxID=3241599 RepID=UPI0035574E18